MTRKVNWRLHTPTFTNNQTASRFKLAKQTESANQSPTELFSKCRSSEWKCESGPWARKPWLSHCQVLCRPKQHDQNKWKSMRSMTSVRASACVRGCTWTCHLLQKNSCWLTHSPMTMALEEKEVHALCQTSLGRKFKIVLNAIRAFQHKPIAYIMLSSTIIQPKFICLLLDWIKDQSFKEMRHPLNHTNSSGDQ